MYPNSALSAGQLAIMAVVVTAALAAWLILVFLAARQPRDTSAAVNTGPREDETTAIVTQLPSGDRPSGTAAALSSITPQDRAYLSEARTRHDGLGREYANSQITHGSAGKHQLHDHLEV